MNSLSCIKPQRMFTKYSLGQQLYKYSGKSFVLHSAVGNRCLQSEMSGEVFGKPVEHSIHKKLVETFNPVHLDILNESHMHNVPPGSETHFKVVVVSDKFNNLPLIKRHRMVNDALSLDLQNGVHALSIVAKTPAQWEESTKQVSPSPACRGGFGK